MEYHAGLRYAKSLVEEEFEWPSTHAVLSIGTEGNETEYQVELDLHKSGYMIWRNGRRLKNSERLNILRRIVNRSVPELRRKLPLKEVAEVIASHCKKYKRQGRNENAIDSYGNDLAWLKKTYYDRNGRRKSFR